jgi:hypothetical protein
MSALGQKPTCAPQQVMSALPPKADMCGANSDVRYGPKADILALMKSYFGGVYGSGWDVLRKGQASHCPALTATDVKGGKPLGAI